MSQIFSLPPTTGLFTPDQQVNDQQAAYTWLSQFALLRIQGPDSERFLQGQLTCDVHSLNPGHWTLGACCTAKGRMVANFVIARDPQDGYWLRLPDTQLPALTQHLKKYAVFFKTELIDLSDSHKITAYLPAVPNHQTDLNHQADQRLIGWQEDQAELSYPDGRREYWMSNQLAEQQLKDQSLCQALRWNQFDISNGCVWVDNQTREHWIPQNIDWHHQGGVSFNKGCYTGQEIVARFQYLGKSKKALFFIDTDQQQAAATLNDIRSPEGKLIGEVCSWNGRNGLALINDIDGLNQAILVTESSEIPISIKKLSYTQSQVNDSDA